MRDHGIAAGDRVALFMHNATAYLECFYGIWWIGAVAVPINAKLHGREAAWICADAGAKLAIVDRDTHHGLHDATKGLALLRADDDAYRALRDGDGEPVPQSRDNGALADARGPGQHGQMNRNRDPVSGPARSGRASGSRTYRGQLLPAPVHHVDARVRCP